MLKAFPIISLIASAGPFVTGCGNDERVTDLPEVGGNGGYGGGSGASGSSATGGTAGVAGSGGLGGCGDGICAADEDCQSCAADCKLCAPPSCKSGLVCGALSCCSAGFVPGGAFKMGRSADGSDGCPCDELCRDDEVPEHRGQVADFYLDTFEVTVGRFRTFVEQYDGAPEPGAGAHPFIEGSGWDSDWDNFIAPDSALLKEGLRCDPVYATWTESGGEYVNRPINCVTWYEAFAFCAWDGGRLPTEQEWEYVAAGGEFNQLYPWGSDAPTQSLASYDCLFDGTVGCNNADLPDVGSLPAGAARWNHLDMSGGVYEWTLDSFVPDWYSGEGSDCQNCANLIRGSQRVIRGGSFSHTTPRLRAASRDDAAPSDRTNFIGFRCARDFER